MTTSTAPEHLNPSADQEPRVGHGIAWLAYIAVIALSVLLVQHHPTCRLVLGSLN